jgi:membrane protease YdiL (CAAX protease family)
LSDSRPGSGEPSPDPAPDVDPPLPAVPDDRGDIAARDAASSGGEVTVAPRGSRTFSLEGRVVPGLYLVGWLGTLLGLGTAVIGVLGGAGPVFVLGIVVLAIGLLAAGGSQALERARQVDRAYRGPSPWLVFAAVIALSLAVQVVIVIVAKGAGIATTVPLLTTFLLGATALVYAFVVRFLVVGTGALTWREMGLRRPDGRALSDLGAGAFLGIPLVFLTGLLAAALAQVLPIPPSPLPDATSGVDVIANLLTAAIIAPIGEELFFRGFATTAWARTLAPTPAIVRGALFFALAHVLTLGDVQQSVYAFVVRLPVGLALGWIFLQRRSLYASIGLHAMFNAIPVLLLASAAR